MYLTENFTYKEMIFSQTSIRLGIDNTPPSDVLKNLVFLCSQVLQPLRNELGPLIVTSGYRCKELNFAVGGVKNSAHIYGLAADIVSPNYSAKDIINILVSHEIPFDKAINELNEWVHIAAAKDAPRRLVIESVKDEDGKVYYKNLV